MSVTITAIAGPAAPGPDLTAQFTLQEFVAGFQNSAASGMPQLANPAALASEMSGFLRNYVEKTQSVQRAMRVLPAAGGDSDGLLQTVALERPGRDQYGGPPRERIEPPGADGSALPPAARPGLVTLERVNALMLAQMESLLVGSVLTSGTSQVIHSFDSLIKGQ